MKHLIKISMLCAILVLTSCVTTEAIRPGSGTQFTISGLSYDQVWEAANRAVDRNYAIAKKDYTRGMIEVERKPEHHRWKENVVVFILPPTDAATHTIEVAVPDYMKMKMTSKNFKAVVLEDIKAELDLINDKEGYKRKLGL